MVNVSKICNSSPGEPESAGESSVIVIVSAEAEPQASDAKTRMVNQCFVI